MRKSVLDIFFSKTKRSLLSAFLSHPERWWYLSDLASYVKTTPSSLQRDLKAFVGIDFLETERRGRMVYYRANPRFPGFDDLQTLFEKTAGVPEAIRSALRKYFAKIDMAFIYGSIARSSEVSESDVDVIIIGEIKLMELGSTLRKLEKEIGREVNVTIYSRDEFLQKSKAKNSFLVTVKAKEKIFLKGSEVELEALA